MKKKFSRQRIRYWFDYVMSRGTIAMSILLFVVVLTIVCIIGLVAFLVAEEGSLGSQMWASFMHTLDAGTLAGNDTTNIPYVILMTVSTLCGLFVTSILIGIISTGVESRLNSLRKGTTPVQEERHTVIIGFDSGIYSILTELIEANANHKNSCIVVLGQQPKEEMEEAIATHIPHTKTTRIICRSGSLHEAHALALCAAESCRSVILNIHEDAETVKAILALSAYLKGKTLVCPELRFVAAIEDDQYLETARIAGEGRGVFIHVKDAIARIIAHTCRQHGLAQVLTDLFSFSGNELYFESVPAMEGKSFREVLLCFSNATAVGLCSGGQVFLNPPMDMQVGKGDYLILLEEDDGAYTLSPSGKQAVSATGHSQSKTAQASDHLIVLGSNDKLPIILSEYDQYVAPGTTVLIVDDDLDSSRLSTYRNLDVSVCSQPVTRRLLSEFLGGKAQNILLLNDDSLEPERSDSQTLLRLILLRDISDQSGRHFTITTEMHSVDNQRLASQARVDDFVIGANFSSLLMAQISENPLIAPLIADILDESGSELYLKPAEDYIPVGIPVDSCRLTECAASKGEIYIGYRHIAASGPRIIINPPKNETIVFTEGDQVIVIAEN